MDTINMPQMLAYIPAPWILWGMKLFNRFALVDSEALWILQDVGHLGSSTGSVMAGTSDDQHLMFKDEQKVPKLVVSSINLSKKLKFLFLSTKNTLHFIFDKAMVLGSMFRSVPKFSRSGAGS